MTCRLAFTSFQVHFMPSAFHLIIVTYFRAVKGAILTARIFFMNDADGWCFAAGIIDSCWAYRLVQTNTFVTEDGAIRGIRTKLPFMIKRSIVTCWLAVTALEIKWMARAQYLVLGANTGALKRAKISIYIFFGLITNIRDSASRIFYSSFT